MDKVTQTYFESIERIISDLDKKFTDRHILTNDRINEAFEVIKMLERKTSDE